jgi:hypothetical protein
LEYGLKSSKVFPEENLWQNRNGKFVNYVGTDFFIFHEFLSSYLLSARRIQNIGLRSLPQMRNARVTSHSWCAGGLLEADSHVGLSEGPQHQFNINNIYL